MFRHDGIVLAAAGENAAVYLRVQGFHPAIHHLGEAGVVRDLGDFQAVFLEQAVGAAGGTAVPPRLSLPGRGRIRQCRIYRKR